MKSNLHPTRTFVALGAALALTIAACGGDDDVEPASEPASDEPAAEPPAADEPPAEVAVSPSILTVGDQDGDGTSVTIAAVELPSAGFIAVHGDGGGSPGPVVGVSELLPAGDNTEVVVALAEPLTATGTVFPMVHIDTDGNGVYEFGTVEGVDGPGTTADGAVAVAPVQIRIAGTDAAAEEQTNDAAPAGDTITISDFSFSGVTEVAVGTTVVVTNTDGTPHTWTAEDDSFESGALAQGDSFEFTFTEPGEFAYFCGFHPSMTGTITVTG